jgi:putative transcriptional regulator
MAFAARTTRCYRCAVRAMFETSSPAARAVCGVRWRHVLLWLAALLAGPGVAGELPGVFLVAAPEISDPRFARSVILLRRHAFGGTIGVVVNRPSEIDLAERYPGNTWLAGHARWLFDGGPVETGQSLLLVRTPSFAPSNALRVFDDVYLSHDAQLLEDVLHHPRPLAGVRVFRGHARWARGQLEREIVDGHWTLTEADADTLFAADPATLWERLVARGREGGT